MNFSAIIVAPPLFMATLRDALRQLIQQATLGQTPSNLLTLFRLARLSHQ
jgi:hypothetical protein